MDFHRFLCFSILQEDESEILTVREKARRSSQMRPVVFQQQQNASVEWQGRLSLVRGTVVTDRSGDIVFSRKEKLRDFL